jgi:hypothetical protein
LQRGHGGARGGEDESSVIEELELVRLALERVRARERAALPSVSSSGSLTRKSE